MPEQAIERRKARVTPEGNRKAPAREKKKPGKGIQTPVGDGKAGAAPARGGDKATRAAGKPGQGPALRAKKKVHGGKAASDAGNGVSGTGAPAARRAATVAE